MPKEFKDLFSIQASDYAKFRPTYPETLFQYLSSQVSSHQKVWDCGTGNGQAAVALARYFDQVIATDPSEKQISSAEKNPKVIYFVGSAEDSSLEARSVDLVTVAQAFHWFNEEAFFSEVKRVLKPGGVLAIWCYGLAKIEPGIDEVIYDLYKNILGGYWEKERQLVEEGYRHVEFPFQEINPPKIQMQASWSLEQLVGYLGTWSALQTYIKKNQTNPLEKVYPRLVEVWGEDKVHVVKWDLALRLGRQIMGF